MNNYSKWWQIIASNNCEPILILSYTITFTSWRSKKVVSDQFTVKNDPLVALLCLIYSTTSLSSSSLHIYILHPCCSSTVLHSASSIQLMLQLFCGVGLVIVNSSIIQVAHKLLPHNFISRLFSRTYLRTKQNVARFCALRSYSQI